MGVALGIHAGHHAACAVMRDGELVSAVQLERLSRRKYHSVESLSNALPVEAALAAAGVTLDDVDLIVSSFQSVSIASFGLHRPLVEPSFSLFDPWAERHRVISHHLAHAYCAVAYTPSGEAAVIVSDYGGSTTPDGADFERGFAAWYAELTGAREPVALRTECLSIYRAALGRDFALQHREFFVPHNQSRSFVHSIASLYENVTRAVFRKPNAHGQLMALAAYGAPLDAAPPFALGPIVDTDGEAVRFRNDWQQGCFGHDTFDQTAFLAHRCQAATEEAIVCYARQAARTCGSRHLALAGGTFLNITANARLVRTGLFDTVSLPSAPHDAGIAVGCAVRGAVALGDRVRPIRNDRLGRRYGDVEAAQAAGQARGFTVTQPASIADIARQIAGGAVIARCAGRAEFGPRALGGRSLLASPLLAASKQRLNQIKGRQPWRPVAPVVRADRMGALFDGPADSPWMTFCHLLRPPHAGRFPALDHPDGTTRAQSLEPAQDPWLHDLLTEFERITGYAVLVNTSLNGPGEPIIETPAEAIQWFLENPDVDALVLDGLVVTRRPATAVLEGTSLAPAPDVLVTQAGSRDARRVVVIHGAFSHELASPVLRALFLSGAPVAASALFAAGDPAGITEAYRLVIAGALMLAPGEERRA